MQHDEVGAGIDDGDGDAPVVLGGLGSAAAIAFFAVSIEIGAP
jgi:hypothetical protein